MMIAAAPMTEFDPNLLTMISKVMIRYPQAFIHGPTKSPSFPFSNLTILPPM